MKRSIAGLAVLWVLSWGGSAFAGYRSVLNQWTGSKQWFSTETFSANIIWHATYFSPEFRRAFAQRHVKKKYLDAVEAARYLAEQEAKQAKAHEFFIGIYTRKPYRNVTSGSDSFWEMVLTTADGRVVEAASVEMVPIGPYEKVMYPYLNRWSQAYRVTFPKVTLGDSFKLTLRSVLGQSSLAWK